MNRVAGIVIIAVLLAGCGKTPPPKFAQESNAKRKVIGLPLILNGWENYNKEFNDREAAWRIPSDNDRVPRHSGKKVLYESGSWALEQDYYYSGKTFPSLDPDAGTESEEVVVSYAFLVRSGYPLGWTCHYHGPTNFMTTISLKDAESILSSWGLTRLNY